MFNKNSSAGTAAQKSSKSSLLVRSALLLAILLLSAVYCQAQTDLFDFYKLSGKIDTVNRYYVNIDSFLIRYIHSGNYMSTLVGRMICDIDSSRRDTIEVYDGTDKPKKEILFGRKNCREDTAFYNADRHYYSHVKVYKIKNGQPIQIGKEMLGYYVPHGCYEDVPENWVETAKKESVSNSR